MKHGNDFCRRCSNSLNILLAFKLGTGNRGDGLSKRMSKTCRSYGTSNFGFGNKAKQRIRVGSKDNLKESKGKCKEKNVKLPGKDAIMNTECITRRVPSQILKSDLAGILTSTSEISVCFARSKIYPRILLRV